MQPSRKGGLYFYKSRVVRVSDYNTLEFWVHGGTSGGQLLHLILQSGGRPVATLPLASLLPAGQLLAGHWQKVSVNLASLSLPNGVFDGILLQDATNLVQPPLYVDDMVLRYQGQLTALKLSTQQLALKTGTTVPLQASALYADGRSLLVTTQVQWASANPAVA
jgi:hypothetical protein